MTGRNALFRLADAVTSASTLHDPALREALRVAIETLAEDGATFEETWKRLGWKDERGYEREIALDFWRAGRTLR